MLMLVESVAGDKSRGNLGWLIDVQGQKQSTGLCSPSTLSERATSGDLPLEYAKKNERFGLGVTAALQES